MLNEIQDILTKYVVINREGKKVNGAVSELQLEINSLFEEEKRQIIEDKDNAYKERNLVVSALSKVFPAHLCRHDENDTTWEDEWRWIVCIHIPVKVATGVDEEMNIKDGIVTKSVTWHIHDSEKYLFDHLEVLDNHWDGHSSEEKYKRLSKVAVKPINLIQQVV